jgi:hypothetical protein
VRLLACFGSLRNTDFRLSRLDLGCSRRRAPRLGVSPAAAHFGGDRQSRGPGGRRQHDVGEFAFAAGAVRHLADDLVVNMQDDGIAGGFKTQHRGREQIARDRRDRVLHQRAVPGIGIAPGAGGIVFVADVAGALELTWRRARFRKCQTAAGRQRHEQGAALHVEGDALVERDRFPGVDAAVRRALERVPEPDGGGVASPKLILEAFHLGVGIGVGGIEPAPGVESTAEAEGQVVGLA